jgi:hypothetical protein
VGRAGYLASSSPHEHIRLFHRWALENWLKFERVLKPGERVMGEWMLMAHGQLYSVKPEEVFIPFDIFRQDNTRLPYREFLNRVNGVFLQPRLLHLGPPCPHKELLRTLNAEPEYHGSLEPPEGYVARVENDGKVDFLCKWVREDKVDGKYFGDEPTWNINPRHIFGWEKSNEDVS